MQEYDAIVIGAGNGGMITASKLAQAGKKVLIVEQHNLPGGCATSFVRGRFEFETSLHELAAIGTKEDPGRIRELLEECGVDIDWVAAPDLFRIVTKTRSGKDLDVSLPTGREPFMDEMEKNVPGSREGFEKFFALADEMTEALEYMGSAEGGPDPMVMMEKYGNFLRTANYPAAEVLTELGISEDAQDIIGPYWSYFGVDMDRLAFMLYATALNNYVTRAAYIPKATSHQLSLAIIEGFKRFGGEIWYNTRCEKILFDKNNAVRGILTTRGEIACKHVIANVSPHILYTQMIPPEIVPEREIKLANARKIGSRALVVYLGLNKSVEELGIEDYSVFLQGTADSRKTLDAMDTIETNVNAVALCISAINPDAAPKGTTEFSFTALYSEDAWGEIETEDYFKMKSEVAKKYIDTYEQKTGIIIHDCIEEIEVATPWTFARYINSPQGSIYGYDSNDWDGVMARVMSASKDYPIKGLKTVGAHGPRGDGYSMTYLCGEMIAKMVLADMAEEAE